MLKKEQKLKGQLKNKKTISLDNNLWIFNICQTSISYIYIGIGLLLIS